MTAFQSGHVYPFHSSPLRADVSAAASSVLTLCYVGGLYISSSTRVGSTNSVDQPGAPLHKDHPLVVRARLKSVCWSTAIGVAGTAGLIVWNRPVLQQPLYAASQSLRLLGVPIPQFSGQLSKVLECLPYFKHLLCAIAFPLALTSILYLGPLYVSWLDDELPGQGGFDYKRDVRGKWDNIWGLRNFVVGPATEELVFRSCILTLTFSAGASRFALIFATPFYFAIAHLHHAWEVYVRDGKTKEALKRGCLQAVIQLTYTTLFGWYANFLLMRTGSVLSPFAAHVFCNVQGLPNPFRAVQSHPKRARSIYVAHIAGVAAFAMLLKPFTSASLHGVSPYCVSV